MSVDFLAAVASRAADGLLPPLSASYARLAAQMTPMERRLLAGDLVLADLDAHAMARELLKDLKHDGDQHDWASRRSSGVLVEPAALSARACASLREAVDTSIFEELDVDNPAATLPRHQHPLEKLWLRHWRRRVGARVVRRLPEVDQRRAERRPLLPPL
jgi:hypothetical protein